MKLTTIINNYKNMKSLALLIFSMFFSLYGKAQIVNDNLELYKDMYNDSLILDVLNGVSDKIDYWVIKGADVNAASYDCEISANNEKELNPLSVAILYNDTSCIKALSKYCKLDESSMYFLGKLGNLKTNKFLLSTFKFNNINIYYLYTAILDRSKLLCQKACILNLKRDITLQLVSERTLIDSVFATELKKDTTPEGIDNFYKKYNIDYEGNNIRSLDCPNAMDSLSLNLTKLIYEITKIRPNDYLIEYAATRDSRNYLFVDYFVIDKSIIPKSMNDRINISRNFINRKKKNLDNLLITLLKDTAGISTESIDFCQKIINPLIDSNEIHSVNNLFNEIRLPFSLLKNSNCSINALLNKVNLNNQTTTNIEIFTLINSMLRNGYCSKNEFDLVFNISEAIKKTDIISIKSNLSFLLNPILSSGYVLDGMEAANILASSNGKDDNYIVREIIRFIDENKFIDVLRFYPSEEKYKIINLLLLGGGKIVFGNSTIFKDAVNEANEKLVLELAEQKPNIANWSNYDIIDLFKIILSSKIETDRMRKLINNFLSEIQSKEVLNKLLILAVQNNNYLLTSILIENKAEVSYENALSLRCALNSLDKNIVELLINQQPTISWMSEFESVMNDYDASLYLAKLILSSQILNCNNKLDEEKYLFEKNQQLNLYTKSDGLNGKIINKSRFLSTGSYHGLGETRNFHKSDCNFDPITQRLCCVEKVSLTAAFFCNKLEFVNKTTKASLICAERKTETFSFRPNVSGSEIYYEYDVTGAYILPKIAYNDNDKRLISPFAKIKLYTSGYDAFYSKNDNNLASTVISQKDNFVLTKNGSVILDRRKGDISIQIEKLKGTSPEIEIIITNDFWEPDSYSSNYILYDYSDGVKDGSSFLDRFKLYCKIYNSKVIIGQNSDEDSTNAVYSSYINNKSQEAVINNYNGKARENLNNTARNLFRADTNVLKLSSFFAYYYQAVNSNLPTLKLLIENIVKQNVSDKINPSIIKLQNEVNNANQNLDSALKYIELFYDEYLKDIRVWTVEYQVYLMELAQYYSLEELKTMLGNDQEKKNKLKIIYSSTNEKKIDSNFNGIIKYLTN